MKVFDASVTPVPQDRVVMVIDMEETRPAWEFAHWAADAAAFYDGPSEPGWCVADQETLFWAALHDELGVVAQSVITEPSFWMEVPPVPQAEFHERVAEEEKQLTA